MENLSKAKQPFMVTGACLGWFALIFQFYLILANRRVSVPETVIRYFTFFTILSNLLVAVCFTCLLLRPLSRWGRFFSAPPAITAVTSYIVLVGIVYNVFLRALWSPQGLQKLVDELLHSVNPLLFLLFWIFFVPKSGLRWKAVFGWLIFPILYVVIVLLRGAFSGYYPYPFVDAGNLGYPKVLLNTSILILVFFLISLLLVWVGKQKSR